MATSVKAEIEKLRDELRRHNRLYFVEAKPEITDLEYDKLMARLVKLEAEHPEFDVARQSLETGRRHAGRRL